MESETDGMHTFVVIIWANGFSWNALVTGIGAANAEQADALRWIEKKKFWLYKNLITILFTGSACIGLSYWKEPLETLWSSLVHAGFPDLAKLVFFPDQLKGAPNLS